MRSRYAAYVVQDVDYVMRTHDPATVDAVDRDGAADWSRDATWHGLQILDVEAGGPDDQEGIVEFVANYELDAGPVTHHERSRFRRLNGEWVYVDGDMVRPAPMVRSERKVGRNEPCTCGSGKKYKKCCGSVAVA